MSFIVNLARTSLSLVLIVATSAVSADECVPSPWGADDQIGAANRVTLNAQRRLQNSSKKE